MHSMVMLSSWALAMYFKFELAIFFGAVLSFVMLFLKTTKWLFTWANAITTVRFVLIAIAIGLADNLSYEQLFVMLGIAVLLDVADGFLARKLKESSALGLHYDMEVDAFFVLIMGVYFFISRDVPFWILVPGLLRYLYTTMMALWPKQSFSESKQKYASTIAGVFFVILLLAIIMAGPIQLIMLAIGSALIMLSFGKSFYDYFSFKGAVN